MSWNPILVGVDDSPESVIAVETGIRYAKAMDVACSLAHAARDIAPIPGTTPGTVDTGRMAEEVVALARRQVTARLKSHVPEPLLASMEVRVGRASRVLADVAADRRAGLVVLGGKRHTAVARWLGGSTAKQAVRSLETSVLVTVSSGPPRKVLAAVDLSDAATAVVRSAERLAELFEAQLRVLHVIEPFPYALDGVTVVDETELGRESEATFRDLVGAKLSLAGAEPVTRRGPALAAIEEEATAWKADLVVAGAHGRHGVERLLIGSVSEGIVNALPASVLVVRPAGLG